MNIQLYFLLFLFIWPVAIIIAKTFAQRLITGIACILFLILIKTTAELGITILSQPISPILALLTLFTGIGFIIYQIINQVPTIQKEESGSSREFWMFIGSLVFLLSALVIIGNTSLPVFNKIFGTKLAPAEDPEFAYNSIQVYVAVVIGLLTGISQYLKYKGTSGKYFWKKIGLPVAIAVVAASILLLFGNINYDKKGPVFLGSIWLAAACSVFTIIANAAYIWLGLKGKLKLSGGSISHVGFGMVLLGILIASSKKEVLSHNVNGIFVPLGKGEDPKENLTLVQGVPANMGKYELTYIKDSLSIKEEKTYFKIRFKNKNGKEELVLQTNSYINPDGKEGLMSNPDSRQYWDHDVFTYITSLPNPDKQNDTATFRTNQLKIGDSLFYSNGFMILQDVKPVTNVPPDIAEILGDDGKIFEAPLKVFSKTGSIFTIAPKLTFAKGDRIAVPDTLTSESLVFQFQNVNADSSIQLGVKESNNVMKYVTLKAYKFPFINLLWLGVVVTAAGIIISMVRRIQLNRNSNSGS